MRAGRWAVAAAALWAAIAVPGVSRAEGAGAALETIWTEDGPRVLLAGVGVGTKYERAASRLGGDAVGRFFGTEEPLTREFRLNGLPCDLMVEFGEGRVSGMTFWCRGGREELAELGEGIAAALEGIEGEISGDGISWFHGGDVLGFLSVREEDGERVLAFSVRQ